jgi:hypothetical protein
MAYFTRFGFDVDEKGVQSFLEEGGDIHDLLNDIARLTKEGAEDILLAGRHIRTTDLYMSLQWNRAKRTGVFKATALATAKMRYATWVHEGTLPTVTNNGKFMKVPKDKGIARGATLPKGQYSLRKVVRGQPAVKYLSRALDAAVPVGLAINRYP